MIACPAQAGAADATGAAAAQPDAELAARLAALAAKPAAARPASAGADRASSPRATTVLEYIRAEHGPPGSSGASAAVRKPALSKSKTAARDAAACAASPTTTKPAAAPEPPPSLEAALAELDKISKNDLTVLKSFARYALSHFDLCCTALRAALA